ncbi:MAG: DUF2314 domain-containing protein [Armatimonadota bacterium]
MRFIIPVSVLALFVVGCGQSTPDTPAPAPQTKASETPAPDASKPADPMAKGSEDLGKVADSTGKADPEAAASANAMKHAREVVGKFWEVFDKPGADDKDFAVFVKTGEGDKTGFVWLTEISHADGKVTGTVGDGTDQVAAKKGDKLTVPETDIYDWRYSKGGKMVGFYTGRAIATAQAAGKPLGEGWSNETPYIRTVKGRCHTWHRLFLATRCG